MSAWFFASDLHGRIERYTKLLAAVVAERPAAVLLGGDLLPSGLGLVESADPDHQDFVNGFLAPAFERTRAALGADYPAVFALLGNDDPRFEEAAMLDAGHARAVAIRPRPADRVGRLHRLRVRVRAAHALPPEGLGALRRLAVRGSRVLVARRRVANRARQRVGRPVRHDQGRPRRAGGRRVPSTEPSCCSTRRPTRRRSTGRRWTA